MGSAEGKEIIKGIEQQLGLDPHAYPRWGYGPEETTMFPEEAPTILQREGAGQCLDCLSSFVGAHQAMVARGDASPLTPDHMRSIYLDTKAELRERAGPHFVDFDLIHVLGAAKRSIAWFEELRRFEETHDYDRDLARLRPLTHLLTQAIQAHPHPHPGQRPPTK